MKQVNKTHYIFSQYANIERFSSYFWQLQEIHTIKPKTILEIGVGDKVIGNYLRCNTEIQYTSVDIAEDTSPDVVGSILDLPFKDNSFDAVCAFEVLEHLPFESFQNAVQEMCRVSKSHVLISIPHFGPPLKFLLKIPFFSEIKFSFKLPYHPKHVWNGQHYWELGKNGYTKDKIVNILEEYGDVTKEYVPFENQYHHFFVLKKKV